MAVGLIFVSFGRRARWTHIPTQTALYCVLVTLETHTHTLAVGCPGGSEYNFSVVPALLTVYLLHELKVPDKRVYDRDKTKLSPTQAGEERECQRTAEVTDQSLNVNIKLLLIII
jgi:hypothetical protein